MVKVAVLGAGVVGLSTAVRIQQCLPHAEVTIIADKFTKDTTSHGAGGIFLPTYQSHPDTPRNRLRSKYKAMTLSQMLGRVESSILWHFGELNAPPDALAAEDYIAKFASLATNFPKPRSWKWAETSFQHYRVLVIGQEAGDVGGIIQSGNILTKQPYEDPLFKDIVFSYSRLNDAELNKLNLDGVYKYGYEVTTLILYQGKYLPWLMNSFRSRGGRIVKRKLQNLSELVGVYDVVLNCTGLGSREFLTDPKLHPIRGHLIRVKAPWIKRWIYTDDLTLIMPIEDLVVLGGVKQKDRDDTNVILGDTKDILARCKALIPSLKDAVIENEWIGLRPGRYEIRVERETMHFNNGQLKVVHNYGHGANGIALSWGTAVEATDLAIQALREHSLK